MKKIALMILLLVLAWGLTGCPWWHHRHHPPYPHPPVPITIMMQDEVGY